MGDTHSDAIVFFGATGDSAFKKIFPALQAMAKRGDLNVPVIGVAKAGWTLDDLRARAKDSVETYGGLDQTRVQKLIGLLRYVDGDYGDAATFAALRQALGGAERPAHYLAIPPPLFGLVVQQLAQSGCATGARVVVEKPFGHDLASARDLNRILLGTFAERDIFRIDHYLGKRPVHNMLFFRFLRILSWRPFWNRSARRERADQTWRRSFGIQGRGAFYETRPARIRDVVQNHLFQVLSNVAMEPPARLDSESLERRESQGPEGHPRSQGPRTSVLGQFRGYREERGVAVGFAGRNPHAAVRLFIDSWRWQGVPFDIRTGKCLPLTSTELVIRLRQPPTVFPSAAPLPGHLRFF